MHEVSVAISKQIHAFKKKGLYIHSLFKQDIPLFFISKLEEINSIYVQPRFEHMQHQIDKREGAARECFNKCNDWFNRYMNNK